MQILRYALDDVYKQILHSQKALIQDDKHKQFLRYAQDDRNDGDHWDDALSFCVILSTIFNGAKNLLFLIA